MAIFLDIRCRWNILKSKKQDTVQAMESFFETGNLRGDVTVPFMRGTHGVHYMHEQTKLPVIESMPGLFSQLLLHSLKDQVAFIDSGFRVVWTNRTNSKTNLGEKLCYEAFHGKREPCIKCPVALMFRSGKPTVVEKLMPLSDGSHGWFEVRTYPVCDQRKEVVFAFAICFDITHRRRSFEKREQYIESLERMVKQMERDIPQAPSSHPENKKDSLPRLTRRELEVLKLVTEGFTNSEIAQRLSLSPHTVKSHVNHIFSKLDVSDRTQAAVQAVRLKLI